MHSVFLAINLLSTFQIVRIDIQRLAEISESLVFVALLFVGGAPIGVGESSIFWALLFSPFDDVRAAAYLAVKVFGLTAIAVSIRPGSCRGQRERQSKYKVPSHAERHCEGVKHKRLRRKHLMAG